MTCTICPGSYHEGVKVLEVHGGHVGPFPRVGLLRTRGCDDGVAAPPLQRAAGRPEEAVADTERRHGRAELVLVGITALQDRVCAGQRPGVVDRVTGADVSYEDQCSLPAAVDPLVALVFLLDDADLVRLEHVDAPPVADDGDLVNRQLLIRGIEVERELGGVLDAGGGEDVPHRAEVTDLRPVAGANLMIGEEVADTPAHVLTRHRGQQIDRGTLDPGGRRTDVELARCEGKRDQGE